MLFGLQHTAIADNRSCRGHIRFGAGQQNACEAQLGGVAQAEMQDRNTQALAPCAGAYAIANVAAFDPQGGRERMADVGHTHHLPPTADQPQRGVRDETIGYAKPLPAAVHASHKGIEVRIVERQRERDQCFAGSHAFGNEAAVRVPKLGVGSQEEELAIVIHSKSLPSEMFLLSARPSTRPYFPAAPKHQNLRH